jgi:hypothetical protein
MAVSRRFFNRTATFDALTYPQDAAGGEIPTPATTAVLVPCCVQNDGPPTPTETQGRRGSAAPVKLFFRPDDPPGIAIIQALKANDRVVVSGYPNPIILDGPPFDDSGRSGVFEASGRDIR